jgi:hypothetical protein
LKFDYIRREWVRSDEHNLPNPNKSVSSTHGLEFNQLVANGVSHEVGG